MPVLVEDQTSILIESRRWMGVTLHLSLLAALTVAAIFVHGYHPYVVDGSIYVTGIKKSIHPLLFAHDDAFVATHARLSAFSRVMAGLQEATGISLDWLLLLTYAALLWGLLAICFLLGQRVAGSRAGGWGATLLMATCFPVPVAATSLLLVDPYLTARSFSTPAALLAVLACVEGRRRASALLCLLTACFHPLMGVYIAAFVVLYWLVEQRRWRWIGASCVVVFCVCGGLFVADLGTPVSAVYREAVQSRDYYFPAVWHWYELVGLVAPVAMMAATWRWRGLRTETGRLALTSVLLAAISSACCFCFVHRGGPYLLARLQMLRSFHTIYAVGVILLGSSIAVRLSRGGRAWAAAGLAVCAMGMFLMQRHTFSALPDVERPGARQNAWEEGFVWIRDHAPAAALFAMEPGVLDFGQEQAPGFRAVAERSILVDVKDEGLASLFPTLAPAWDRNRRAEEGPGALDDGARVTRLQAHGVDWVILPSRAETLLACPYRNAVMQVCRVAAR
ncbi:MAG TPA: hypothetical protein VGD62_00825 [Acidobacteriaceae bacterium]